MKKTISRGLALLLASMLVLSGCGSTGTTNETSNEPNSEGETTGQEQAESTETASSENEIKDLVISQLGVNEMETFNILLQTTRRNTMFCVMYGKAFSKLIHMVN